MSRALRTFFALGLLLVGVLFTGLGQEPAYQPFLSEIAALAQAQAQAASTSVDVIPSIQTSVQAFIDPYCLRPTCEQYVPTQDYTWDFGQVPAGTSVNTEKGFPGDLTSLVTSLGVAAAVQVGSSLPPGLGFELDPSRRQGRFVGTTPKEDESWRIMYNLLDKNKCPVLQLTAELYTAAVTPCPRV